MNQIRILNFVLLPFLVIGHAHASIQQAFLVQNSGWMEPFYVDSRSQFKPLITAVIDAVTTAEETFTLSTFNQSTAGNESPLVVFSGNRSPQFSAAVDRIGLARKGGGKALADTDFREAVIKTVTGAFQGKPGIIWIFTNNKNSPNNSVETAARNREFYELLHLEPSIVRTLAFPLSMPVKGTAYQANGLMVYALAYGNDSDGHLQSLVRADRFRKILTDTPARLKPLDRDSVRLVPKNVVNAPNTRANLAQDGLTLLLDIDVSSRQPVVEILASFENQFFPYTIENATVSAQIIGKSSSEMLTVTPNAIKKVAPNKEADVNISLPISINVPSVWSPEVLLDMGRSFRIPAVIEVTLADQRLAVDSSFRDRLASIFPGDPLPDVFVPPAMIKSSTASIPMIIRVNYPLYPLLILMFFGLLLLMGALLAMAAVKSEKRYQIVVNGQARSITLKAFGKANIFLSDGKELVGIVKRGLGRPKVEAVSKGHTLSVGR
ncbi:MAG: hypothetical protein WCR74_03105 [Betaproteobacteria bacterium]